MRLKVSTVGTLPYGISKHLADIIQPIINKNQHKLRKSRSFDSQVQTRRYPLITQDLSKNYDNLKNKN